MNPVQRRRRRPKHSQDGECKSRRETLSGEHLIEAKDNKGSSRRRAKHHHDMRRLDEGAPPVMVPLPGADLNSSERKAE